MTTDWQPVALSLLATGENVPVVAARRSESSISSATSISLRFSEDGSFASRSDRSAVSTEGLSRGVGSASGGVAGEVHEARR